MNALRIAVFLAVGGAMSVIAVLQFGKQIGLALIDVGSRLALAADGEVLVEHNEIEARIEELAREVAGQVATAECKRIFKNATGRGRRRRQ